MSQEIDLKLQHAMLAATQITEGIHSLAGTLEGQLRELQRMIVAMNTIGQVISDLAISLEIEQAIKQITKEQE
jgi:hypothetical protein